MNNDLRLLNEFLTELRRQMGSVHPLAGDAIYIELAGFIEDQAYFNCSSYSGLLHCLNAMAGSFRTLKGTNLKKHATLIISIVSDAIETLESGANRHSNFVIR